MEPVFSAKDFDDLHDQLRAINAEVPFHPKDRNNSQVETYALVSLLSSIPWNHSHFPLEVFRRERPDFLIIIKSGSAQIGLEHTEGITQNLAKERALRADGNGPDGHFIAVASVNDPPKTREQILVEILADEPGDGWVGDSVERGWADAIAHFAQKKAINAKKHGYTLFGDDRLMIYDNWSAPGLKHQLALPHLFDNLGNSDVWSVFSRLYVIDESTVLELIPEQCIYHTVRR